MIFLTNNKNGKDSRTFLNNFLDAEVDSSNKYRVPNLEAYNAAVDKIGQLHYR